MHIEKAGVEIIAAVKGWHPEHNKLVVGIEGYSGAGKTTLLKYLSNTYNFIEPLYMDDFVSTSNTKEHLIPQLEMNNSTLSLKWAPQDGLENLRKAITDFKKQGKKGSVLIVEGIFLFHPDVSGDMWDRKIYLDTDKLQADERRVTREKERWGEKYFPETHPDSFSRLFKLAYCKYEELYKPKAQADLVITF